tara:strand:- start:6195 stop:7250 length:1056 start_codon:yes stop_codon:yes gene_type:complete
MKNNTNSVRTILGRSFDLVSLETNFNSSEIQKHLPEACEPVYTNGSCFKYRKIDPEMDDNEGVRSEGTPDAPELSVDFENDGFLSTFFPPIQNVYTGKLLDGRTRENELRKLGEKYMPVMLVRTVKERRNEGGIDRVIGIQSNRQPYGKRTEYHTLVGALVCDITEDVIERDRNQIRERLITDYSVERFYGSGNNIISKIVNEVHKMTDTKNRLIRCKTREEWKGWLLTRGINIDDDISLLQTGGRRAPLFFAEKIVPSLAKGELPSLILYSNTPYETEAKEKTKDFIQTVDRLYRKMFGAVSSKIPNVNIDCPKEKGYNLLGIIPQLTNEFQRKAMEEGKLVTMKGFLNG